jgi:hypothetical protein
VLMMTSMRSVRKNRRSLLTAGIIQNTRASGIKKLLRIQKMNLSKRFFFFVP